MRKVLPLSWPFVRGVVWEGNSAWVAKGRIFLI